MNKELVLSSQFAGIAVFAAYSNLPIVQDFYLVALVLIWRICGIKFSLLYIGIVELMLLPKTVLGLMNSSSWIYVLTDGQRLQSLIQSYMPKPDTVEPIAMNIFVNVAIVGLSIVGIVLISYYCFYKPTRKFFALLDDIQRRVYWFKSKKTIT